jgi:hypothetical protein
MLKQDKRQTAAGKMELFAYGLYQSIGWIDYSFFPEDYPEDRITPPGIERFTGFTGIPCILQVLVGLDR